jgi:AcrR family transcriptional regulator
MQHTDRRSQRTRSALMKAFAQLLLSDGYDLITIERVCARANIGRSTFYLHFPSKEGILRESLAGPSSHLVALVAPEATAETVRSILEHFHQQRKLNAICFTYPVRAMWVKKLGELIEAKLTVHAREIRARPILKPPMVAQQIAETQLALIANWLSTHPSTAPLTIAEALVAATRGVMGALMRCDPNATSAKKA